MLIHCHANNIEDKDKFIASCDVYFFSAKWTRDTVH